MARGPVSTSPSPGFDLRGIAPDGVPLEGLADKLVGFRSEAGFSALADVCSRKFPIAASSANCLAS